MAKMGDIKITVDEFIKASRVHVCIAKCRFNSIYYEGCAGYGCHLKSIELDKQGRCSFFEEVKDV